MSAVLTPFSVSGNFEDDDHNLRCKLAGYTLWVAAGSFLYHHGSTTFRKLNMDYEASIRTNMEIFLTKWKIGRVEDWPRLVRAPAGVSLFVPLSDPARVSRFEVRLGDQTVDLLLEASEDQFAQWVAGKLHDRPALRRGVVEMLEGKKLSA